MPKGVYPRGGSVRTAGSEQDNDDWVQTDAALGIGVEDEPMPQVMDDSAARINSAMADPVIAAAVEQLVQQRVAALAVAQGVPGQNNADFMAGMRELGKMIADSINRSTAATVEQMPGHVKPIPVEEVEARAGAWAEMQAVLRDTNRQYLALMDAGDAIKADELVPVYLLQEDFFADGETGGEMYLAGETVRWFKEPGCHMQPRNAVAKRISELMWRWIGNEDAMTPEQLVDHASHLRRGTVPEIAPMLGRTGPRVGRLVASKVEGVGTVDMTPGRVNGTLVQEMKGGFGRGPRVVQAGL